jgi:hypothetical protein
VDVGSVSKRYFSLENEGNVIFETSAKVPTSILPEDPGVELMSDLYFIRFDFVDSQFGKAPVTRASYISIDKTPPPPKKNF